MADEAAEGIPPIDFTTFVLSMSTACMGHLSNAEAPNVPMARQTLEILELIEKKTAGNLTGEEERILTQVLADLRDALDKA